MFQSSSCYFSNVHTLEMMLFFQVRKFYWRLQETIAGKAHYLHLSVNCYILDLIKYSPSKRHDVPHAFYSILLSLCPLYIHFQAYRLCSIHISRKIISTIKSTRSICSVKHRKLFLRSKVNDTHISIHPSKNPVIGLRVGTSILRLLILIIKVHIKVLTFIFP